MFAMKLTVLLVQAGMLFAVLGQHLASAAKCQAKATYLTNSIGAGIGGTTYTQSYTIALTKDGKEVGRTTDKSACTDKTGITSQLPQVFVWAATCGANTFNECHGAYGDQTHIGGNKPTKGTHFYGLGISTEATCTIDFNC